MASRRTRIKGIANIPQRKKNSEDIPIKIEKCKVKQEISINLKDEELQNPQDHVKQRNIPHQLNDSISANVRQDEDAQNITISKDNMDVDVPREKPEIGAVNVITSQPILPKRKFIKPSVSLSSALVRKSNANGEIKNTIKEEKQTNSKNASVDEQPENILETISTPQTSNAFAEIILNEINLLNNIDNEAASTPGQPQRKLPVTILSSYQLSDTEYPPPPPSPNKINRSRIKAIPRLGYRKTSFSASESEDESRRNSHRIRNDSVCSTTSGVTETIMETMSPQRSKEVVAVHQKKIMRSEQTRKLAEARREFQRRFGSNKPDRQRLTMMDLIFYNPDTNPMGKKNTLKSKSTDVEEIPDDPVNEETEPDQETEKVDEENEMPVPQIKISASGEIILDEKSLVIERKGVKRQREEIQNSTLVDGDFDTSYGVYKKHKKIKNWSNEETVRFYRALTTLGTDFALMCELFPNRDRRELKKKFKKEEKINRLLIDKALMQPCQYAFDELKLDMEREERVQQEKQRQKEEDNRLRMERLDIARKKRVERQQQRHNNRITKELQIAAASAPKKKRIRKPKQLTIESLLDNNSDADVSDVETFSDTEDDIILSHKPTRSGRMPKIRQKFEIELPATTNRKKKNKKAEKLEKKEEMEPGSIMILNEKGPNDEPVYKIFMITPENTNAQPMETASDALQLKNGVRAENILTISAMSTDDEEGDETIEPPLIENNMTIVEDANVTSLKTSAIIVSEDANAVSLKAAKISLAGTKGNGDNRYVATTTEAREVEDANDSAIEDANVSPAVKKSVIVISDQVIVPGYRKKTRDKI